MYKDLEKYINNPNVHQQRWVQQTMRHRALEMIRSIYTDVERCPQHAVNKTSIKPYVQQRKKKKNKAKTKAKTLSQKREYMHREQPRIVQSINNRDYWMAGL